MSTSRATYTAKMKQQIDDLNITIDVLEAKVSEAKAEVRDIYLAELKKVRRESSVAMAKLEELKVAGEDSWDTMVAEMDKIHQAFVHSFHYFKSQL